MSINELRSVTTFVHTAEMGSLRKAATAQGITPQAASQALAQLEQHLGVRLFHRTTRSMSLTEEGLRLLESVKPALVGFQRALQTARVTKEEIAGPLRIVGPHSMFIPVVMPVLEEFCAIYPDIEPDIQLDDRIGNWVEDRVDVGFRIGISPNDGVIARRLFSIQSVICAAPEYLEKYGIPESLDALGSHRCSAFRHPNTGRVVPWHVKVGDNVIDHHVAPAFCTNDEELELRYVLSGAVIGQLTSVTAASYIRARQLIPVLTQHVADHAHYFIYYGSRDALPARTRAFIDFALERLADTTNFILSEQELNAAKSES